MATAYHDCCQPGLTPWFMNAIKLQRQLFSYLYPSALQIGCRDNFAYLEPEPLKSKNLLPWLFSVIFVSGFIGLGSNLIFFSLLLIHGKHELPHWVEFNSLEVILLLLVAFGRIVEIVTTFVLLLNPEIFTAFTEIQIIESNCKFTIKSHNIQYNLIIFHKNLLIS